MRRPPTILKTAQMRSAWHDLWQLLADAGHDEDIYATMVTVMAVELGIAYEAADAVYRPMDPATGKRTKRTLEEYLDGRNSQTAQELTVLRDTLKTAAKLAQQFGGSPQSVKAIGGVREKSTESPMMAYIREANERMKRRTG